MSEQKTDPQKLAIMHGWLVYEVDEHTCGGYGPESGYMHEPGCGFEPIMTVEALDAVLREHAERHAVDSTTTDLWDEMPSGSSVLERGEGQ